MAQIKVGDTIDNIHDKSPITCSKIVNLADESTFYLPPDFLETLGLETDSSHAIMIVSRGNKAINIIPTKSNSIIKISVEIKELLPNFFHDLNEFLMRSNIKTLYTTGLIFTLESCFYDVFIDSNDLSIHKDCLKDELQDIRCVSGIIVTELVC
ncbi:MAG: hypothetical protein ACXAEU_04405 [Candidatus Hodarchaeales archaeon]|jgi:hypothetical protein